MKRRVASPEFVPNLPLRVMSCPLASRMVLMAIVFVFVMTIVPSQEKVTVPPPESAEVNAVSVQLLTTPPAQAEEVQINMKSGAYLERICFIKYLPTER
jgi:hypothetical protein